MSNRLRFLLSTFTISCAVSLSQGTALLSQTFEAIPEIVATNFDAKKEEVRLDWDKALERGEKPAWVWGDDFNKRYTLRKSFKLDGKSNAWIRASGDNSVSVKLNGKPAGSSTAWENPVDQDVSSLVQEGENTIELQVANAGGVAAVVLKLVAIDSKGNEVQIVTDESWQVIENGKPVKAVRKIASYGDQPWGGVLANGGGDGRGLFQVLPGFQIERLFSVPRDKLGSWVAITVDPKGRLIASDQGEAGLVRITPSPIGSNEPTRVEKLNVDISSAQGLLFAFDSLYVIVNGKSNGLYRLRDTNGDDQFDEVKKLADIRGSGEHGPHALRLSPDGKSIMVAAGNHTLLPADRQLHASIANMGGVRSEPLRASLPKNMTSRMAPVWDEDVLPTRLWDANGHATGIFAPGGWMGQCDPEGKQWNIFSIGYRNQYDFDFNADGEMFVYDSDMEWDMGTPWYRPTRVVHAPSGSEFGWRSGTACWPTYYFDSHPSLVDIGPGSPVGVTFGYGAKFPANYQKALYICDWTFGTIYAIHLEPNGSTYTAKKEEFVSRSPLPLTDAVVGNDGAMYFTVGGRGTQSELYRVTYTGKESTGAVDPKSATGSDQRKLRREIEAWHHEATEGEKRPIEMLTKNLSHSDLYIRNAARIALEHAPAESWFDQAIRGATTDGVLQAVAGASKSGSKPLQVKMLSALRSVDWKTLTIQQRLDLVRAYQLTLIRLGTFSEKEISDVAQRVEAWFPGEDPMVNREVLDLLVKLDVASVPSKVIPLMEQKSDLGSGVSKELIERNRGYGSSIASMMANQPDLQQLHYAFVLREQKSGWNIDLRKSYFRWFQKAQKWSGGNSYQKFLVNISNDAYAAASDQDRLAIEAAGLRTPAVGPKELPKPVGPGKDYTVEEIAEWSKSELKNRNFENGRNMYAAARCVLCHRFAGEGGATGPDLTQVAGRFGAKDLIEAIIDPSKVISDQYKTVVISTEDGTFTGRIISENQDEILLLTDPEDSTKTVTLSKKDIDGQKTSAVSMMPKDLVKGLNKEEVLDLLAYLLTRGNANDPVFKKGK